MRRLLTLALVGCLLAAGCRGDGGDGADEPAGRPASGESASQPPPGPAEQLGLSEGWGPSAGQLDRAARLATRMTIPELAGQVIVAEYDGLQAPVQLVRSLHLGGVIAFSNNVASTQHIRQVNTTLRRAVRRPYPVFLSVDQEGGIVERVKSDATRFPTFMSTGAADDPVLTMAAARASGQELRNLGFSVVFAPDADVTSGPGDPTIGSRSAGSRPRDVATHVVAAAGGYVRAALVPVLKHFPGHGSVPQDSHLTLPVQTKSRKALAATELVPFEAAVRNEVPAIMVGHLDVRSIDPGVPSSMSKKVVTGLLRDQLGFGGVAVTDSLSMTGVTKKYDAARSAVLALRAGNDVLLMPPDPRAARAAVVRAVRSGGLSRDRLRQAAARQIAMLLHYQGTRRTRPGRPPGSGRAEARALSAAAITTVSGACQGRLVSGSVTPVGDPVAVSNFAAHAQAAGLDVLFRRPTPSSLSRAEPAPARKKKEKPKAFVQRRKAWEQRERQRKAALSAWLAGESARLAAGTNIAFTGYQDAPVDGEIAIATNTPYVLGSLGAGTKIATYGDTPGAMSALLDVLLGKAKAPGRLPVPVSGVERQGC